MCFFDLETVPRLEIRFRIITAANYTTTTAQKIKFKGLLAFRTIYLWNTISLALSNLWRYYSTWWISTNPHQCWSKAVTIDDHSPLFALFAVFVLFAIRDYSLCRFSRHPLTKATIESERSRNPGIPRQLPMRTITLVHS